MTGKWISVPLGEIAPQHSNGLPDQDSEVWNLSLDEIEPVTGRLLKKTVCRVVDLGSAKCSFDRRHVLYSKLRPYLNKVVIPQEAGVGTSELIPMLPKKERLDREYLAYYLRSPIFLDFANANTRGANLPRISMTEFWRHAIPLPQELHEQRRIVVRIRECLERVEEIEKCRKNLSRDYQTLKFSTVSHVVGSLKKQHPLITVSRLVSNDINAMRSGPFGSAMKHGEFVQNGNLVIGIANVKENAFDPVRKWMINDDKFKVMKRYQVAPGDVLITIMGTIGRTCVVPESIGKAITSKHVYRIRFPSDRVCPNFISYMINFDMETRNQLYGTATGGVMPGLNATKLRNLQLCIPPLTVQIKAVEMLDEMHTALNKCTSMEYKNYIVHLRESILHKAFAREL